MNKIVKSLLAAALCVSAAHAYTNKTTMSLRPHGYNLPLGYTTFNELINRKAEDKFGGNFQVTGFYQGSANTKATGKYFGIKNHDKMILGHIADGAALTTADLDLAYIIHNSAGTAEAATIKFDPRSESYGARFDYFQDLDKILKGLYLSVSLPVVHVENDMRLAVSDVSGAVTAANITDYFKGSSVTTGDDLQDKLAYAKINGKQSDTGVADIEVKLGYNFLEKETYHIGLNIGLSIPTGNNNKGEYVFQPLYGNGQHFALGGGLDGLVRVWGEEDHNIKLGLGLEYRYLFESAEKRTPGLKDYDFGQYHLLAAKTTALPVVLKPAANVITQNCNVTPGSQLEGIANFSYNNGGFVWDLGYNLFWREAESVKSKDTLTASTYGISARALTATDGKNNGTKYSDTANTVGGVFGSQAAQFDDAAITWLAQSDLDFSAASTPAKLSHTIYTGIGYSFKEWDTPLMMGLHGSYEFAAKNNSQDFWMVAAKLGIAF